MLKGGDRTVDLARPRPDCLGDVATLATCCATLLGSYSLDPIAVDDREDPVIGCRILPQRSFWPGIHGYHSRELASKHCDW